MVNVRFLPLVVLFLAGGSAFAQQNLSVAGLPNDDTLALIISNEVRLRSGPSTSGSVIRTLAAGDFAVILGESSDPQQIGNANYYWEHLRLIDGTEGWTYGEYVYEHPRTTVEFSFATKIENVDYTVTEFVSPVSADMRRGVTVGGKIVPVLVKSGTKWGVLIRIRTPATNVTPTEDGWLAFPYEVYTHTKVERVESDAANNLRVTVVEEALETSNGVETWSVKSRTRFTCSPSGDVTRPTLDAIQFDSLPVR